EIDQNGPAVLQGKAKPRHAEEMMSFAWYCAVKKHFAGSARLYAEGFAANPKLAEDLLFENRYYAARAAALAGTGQGLDAGDLDEAARSRWRQQALVWLRADLGQRNRWPSELKHRPTGWKYDPDLAGVRDAAALAELPEAERQAWQQLWADVQQTLTR